MNETILSEIQRTNEILIRLSVLILIGVFFWVLKSSIVIWNQGEVVIGRAWRSKARKRWEKGEYDKLKKESLELIKDAPNNPEGYYWLAMAARGLQDENDLVKAIKKLIELEPGWKEEWMDPYLQAGSENNSKGQQT